jgi:hypothetical protein
VDAIATQIGGSDVIEPDHQHGCGGSENHQNKNDSFTVKDTIIDTRLQDSIRHQSLTTGLVRNRNEEPNQRRNPDTNCVVPHSPAMSERVVGGKSKFSTPVKPKSLFSAWVSYNGNQNSVAVYVKGER